MKLFKILGILLFIGLFSTMSFGQEISLTTADASITEDGGSIDLTFESNNGATTVNDVTITVTFTGSAVNGGTDYTAVTSVVLPTQTTLGASNTITISTASDTFLEGDETIIATITAVSGGDGAPTISVADFSTTFTITDAEYIELATSASPIAENGGSTNYTAQVSGGGTNETGVDIDVNIGWGFGTATPTTDFTGHAAIATIPNTNASSSNIIVTAVSDKLLEPSETIGAQITSLTGAPGGTGYSTATISTTISDDEFVGLAVTNTSIDEDGGTTDLSALVGGIGSLGASFVSDYGADVDIEVSWTSGGPTATYLTDYTVSPVGSPGLFTIPDGASVSNSVITITGVNDVLIEGDEDLIPTIQAAPVLVGGPGAPNSVTVTIIDDDPELVAPGNTLTGVSLFPTFEWVDDAVSSYEIQISTSPTFASILASQNVGSGVNTYQFLEDHASGAFPLNNSTTYYWRIFANGTEYSAIWSFTTVAGISIGVGNPANGSEAYQYDPLYFSWYIAQIQGSIKFRLEIIASGTDPLTATWKNGPWDFSADNIDQVYRTVNGLSGGTKYWWRIIGYLDSNADNLYDPVNDKVVVFSQHYNFTTKGGLVTAYPSWPLGGYTVYSLTPMFGWYTLVYEPGATYQIIVATASSVDGNGMLNSGVVGTYPSPTPQSGMTYTIPGGELTYSTTYYWQVVTHYGGSQVYSSVASFVTYDDVTAQVNKPVLSYPTGGTTIYTDSPILYWYGNLYGSSIDYSIEYSTTGGAPYSVWGTTTGDQFYSVSGLTPGQTYTWIVIADKGGPNEISSDPATFTVTGGASSYPVPSYPTGGVMVYSTTPSLGWYVSGSTLGWSGYYVKWKKTTGAVGDWAAESGTIINDINQTSYMVSPALEEGESYKWAVALYDGVTPPVHSDYVESSFSVYGGASNITINQSTPVNGATGIATNVNFSWWVSGSVSSITSYFVTYSPYADPTLDPSPGTTTPSSNMFASANLSGGTTYKWKVTANISGGGTVESGWYEFTTITTSLAVQPTAGSPSNGVILTSSDAELSWYTKAAPNEGQTYEVEVSDSPMFENVQLVQETGKSSVKVENLDDGQYYWRVRGKNDEGNSYYSNIASFKVGNSVTDVNDVAIIPDNFEVYQNYPNPFNPTTAIKFALSEASFVSIKIYNMLGQEIKTLAAEDRMAGTYSVLWNGDNNNGQKVTSGTYIYRVSAQNSVVTKKMMLLK